MKAKFELKMISPNKFQLIFDKKITKKISIDKNALNFELFSLCEKKISEISLVTSSKHQSQEFIIKKPKMF